MGVTADKHCDHCLTGCQYTVGGDGQRHPSGHLSAYGDMWPDGQCDICALIAEAVQAERDRIADDVEKYADVANASQRARGDVRITDNPSEAIANLADAQVERILRRQVELIRRGYILVAGEV